MLWWFLRAIHPLLSQTEFWEAHVACAGEVGAGSAPVTRGSGIVHLHSWLVRSALLASLGGVETSKEERGFAQQVERTFPSCL